MTQEEIKNRIQKKEEEITKRERNLKKYVVDEEFTAMCDRYFQTKDNTELNNYKKQNNLWCLPEYYSKRYELEEAKQTLAKYQKQLEKQMDKDNTLNDIPEVIKKFQNDLLKRWDEYDEWKKQEIRKELKSQPDYFNKEAYREWRRNMVNKWGRDYHEAAYISSEEIHKENLKAVNELVLNLINRTIEIVGKITDAKYLTLNYDNNGYSIINGIVIGEKAKAIIESIGAGGYNIQKYHIRVLVKEVRA